MVITLLLQAQCQTKVSLKNNDEDLFMKKIAYVIPAFPVASETFITTEMKALMDVGHEIQGICFERKKEACQVGDEKILATMLNTNDVSFLSLMSLFYIVFIQLFDGGLKAFKFAFKQKGIRPRSLLLHGFKLAYLIHTTNCQHVHAHFAQSSTATAIVAARLLGLNVSFTGHGSDVYKSPSDLLLKLQNADFAVAVCKRMQNDFNNLTSSVDVHNVPCGIDMNFFNRSPAECEASINQRRRLLYLGRISETKGVTHLLQALAKLPGSLRPSIDIAGDGVMRLEAEQMAIDLGLTASVIFLGAVNRTWIKTHCSQYAAMVLPFCQVRCGIMDTGPLVIKEAMALKLPLLTTDIMATGEFVDSTCAFVSKSSDPEDLARTLLKLLIALKHLQPSDFDLADLQDKLGFSKEELRVLLLTADLNGIVENKVECGYQKVVAQFSSIQQGQSLSKLFQAYGI